MCEYEAQLQVDWCTASKVSSCRWDYIIVTTSSRDGNGRMINGVQAAATHRDADCAAGRSRLRVITAKERRILARRRITLLIDLFSASSRTYHDMLTRWVTARSRDRSHRRAVRRGDSHVGRADVHAWSAVVILSGRLRRPGPRFTTTRAVVGGVRAGRIIEPCWGVTKAPCTVTTEAADLRVFRCDAVVAADRCGLVAEPQRRHARH